MATQQHTIKLINSPSLAVSHLGLRLLLDTPAAPTAAAAAAAAATLRPGAYTRSLQLNLSSV
jgi:hypothetical protein